MGADGLRTVIAAVSTSGNPSQIERPIMMGEMFDQIDGLSGHDAVDTGEDLAVMHRALDRIRLHRTAYPHRQFRIHEEALTEARFLGQHAVAGEKGAVLQADRVAHAGLSSSDGVGHQNGIAVLRNGMDAKQRHTGGAGQRGGGRRRIIPVRSIRPVIVPRNRLRDVPSMSG